MLKRSEIIKVLKLSFWKHMNSPDVMNDDDMYDFILQDLEKAGMYPTQLVDPQCQKEDCDCEPYLVMGWAEEVSN